jgi:hypothetical protein
MLTCVMTDMRMIRAASPWPIVPLGMDNPSKST